MLHVPGLNIAIHQGCKGLCSRRQCDRSGVGNLRSEIDGVVAMESWCVLGRIGWTLSWRWKIFDPLNINFGWSFFFLTLRDYHLISSLNFCDSFVALVKVGAKLCVQRLCCLSCKLHFCPQQLPKKKVQTFPQHLKSPRLATNSSNKLPPRSLT